MSTCWRRAVIRVNTWRDGHVGAVWEWVKQYSEDKQTKPSRKTKHVPLRLNVLREQMEVGIRLLSKCLQHAVTTQSRHMTRGFVLLIVPVIWQLTKNYPQTETDGILVKLGIAGADACPPARFSALLDHIWLNVHQKPYQIKTCVK